MTGVAIFRVRTIRLAVWACHTIVLAASFGASQYPILALLGLTIAWFVTATSSVVVSKGWRIPALAIVVVSGLLMKDTFYYVILAAACARGNCV